MSSRSGLIRDPLRAKNQEPGREASELRTALPLSKDGSTILDEGPRTALHLFMLFSEDSGRITEDVSLRSSDL